MGQEPTHDASIALHGQFADDGDIRIESSSMEGSGETPQQILDRFKASKFGTDPAAAPEPSAFDPATTDDVPPAEPTTAEPPADPAADDQPDTKPPKKGSARYRFEELQGRIKQSTREIHGLRAEREREEARLAELRKEREALEARPPAATTPRAEAAPPPAATDDPKPTWKQFEDEGKSFDDFIEADRAWVKREAKREILAELDAREAKAREARQADEAKTQEARADEAARARVRNIVQELNTDPAVADALRSDDFLEMPQTPFMGALVKLHAKGPDVLRHLALNPADGYAFARLEMTPQIMQAFRETDDPVRLLSVLANHEDEAQRIARLSPYQAMKALAALEDSSTDAKSGTSAATPRQPQPRPLPAKVGSRPAATVPSLADLAGSTDHADEYFRRRMAGEDVTA